jgi:hypothetical protein
MLYVAQDLTTIESDREPPPAEIRVGAPAGGKGKAKVYTRCTLRLVDEIEHQLWPDRYPHPTAGGKGYRALRQSPVKEGTAARKIAEERYEVLRDWRVCEEIRANGW